MRLLSRRWPAAWRGASRTRACSTRRSACSRTEQRNAELAVINGACSRASPGRSTTRASSSWWATSCAKCSTAATWASRLGQPRQRSRHAVCRRARRAAATDDGARSGRYPGSIRDDRHPARHRPRLDRGAVARGRPVQEGHRPGTLASRGADDGRRAAAAATSWSRTTSATTRSASRRAPADDGRLVDGAGASSASVRRDAAQRAQSSALSEVRARPVVDARSRAVMDRIAAHARELSLGRPRRSSRPTRPRPCCASSPGPRRGAATRPAARGIIGSLLQSGRAELDNSSAADPRRCRSRAPRRAATAADRAAALAGAEVLGAMAVAQRRQPFEARSSPSIEGSVAPATIALQNAASSTRRAPRSGARRRAPTCCRSSAARWPTRSRCSKGARLCQRLFGTDEMGICLVRDGMIDFPAFRGRFADDRAVPAAAGGLGERA